MTSVLAIVVIAAGAVLGVGVPWLTIRMLVGSLEQGPTTENFRGRRVFAGLGTAWLVWAGAAIVMGVLGGGVVGSVSVMPLLTLAGPLALVCFALGLVDDAYGTGSARGFRGHLRALRAGRLTTGGLKLLGVSAASFVVGLVLAQAAGFSDGDMGAQLLSAVPLGAAIALTANFVNLTDLRPARALKVYTVLAVVGVASSVLGLGLLVASPPTVRFVDAAVLLLFALGPVLATWRYDAGERGMLGDAGANSAGAVAGLFIVAGLPLWGVLIYLAFMLALNLASERVSFSKIIEGSTLLRRIDMLGRDAGETGQQTETNPE